MNKPPPPALETFTRLRASFFERYLETQPEEATTLGLHHLDDRLKDLSPSALGDEYAFHRDTLARLELLPPEELPSEARLDRLAMLDVTRFHVHAYEDLRGHRRNVELSTYPHTMLQYQIGQAETAGDWSAITSRAARICGGTPHGWSGISRETWQEPSRVPPDATHGPPLTIGQDGLARLPGLQSGGGAGVNPEGCRVALVRPRRRPWRGPAPQDGGPREARSPPGARRA